MMRSFPRARLAALASILVITFLSGGWLLRPRPSAEGGVYEQARLFEGVVGTINHHYIDSLGEGDLYQRAADALVGSLHDPYAELLIKDSYREYQRQMAADGDRSGARAVGVGVGGSDRRQRHRPGRRGPEHQRAEHAGLVIGAAGRGPSADVRPYRHHGGQAARCALTRGPAVHPHGDPRAGRPRAECCWPTESATSSSAG